MNIQQIKESLGLNNLLMVRQYEQNAPTVATAWLSHWDNERRIRVSMHEDVLTRIKADVSKPGLALKKEIVPATAERAEYTRYVVITPLNIEATF